MASTAAAKGRFFDQLVVVLVLLVIADGLMTRFITFSGLGRETNPLLRTLVSGDEFLLLKVAGAVLAALGLVDFYRRRPQLALCATVVFVGLYTAVVYWNLGVVFFACAPAL